MRLQTRRVSEIAHQIRGVTYGKQDASKTALSGYVPVLRAGNITDDGLTFDDLVYVPSSKVSPNQRIQKNDIVIAASSGSLDVVGKAARALEDFGGGFGAFCKVLRPRNEVNAAYFSHYFKTQDYRRLISSLAAGANINNLRNGDLDDLQIPLPPLAEQQRIAAILDAADALRAKRREALAQLDALLQATFLELFGDPVANPMGWPAVSFDECIEDRTSTAIKVPKSEYSDQGSWQIIDQSQLPVAGRTDTGPPFDERLPVVVFGDHTRCVKLVTNPFVLGADGAKVLAPKGNMCPVYLSNLLPLLKLPDLGYSRHMKEVKRLRYPLPPLPLQRRFATIVESVERQKAAQRAHLAELDALFASLQHRAFRGEL